MRKTNPRTILSLFTAPYSKLHYHVANLIHCLNALQKYQSSSNKLPVLKKLSFTGGIDKVTEETSASNRRCDRDKMCHYNTNSVGYFILEHFIDTLLNST